MQEKVNNIEYKYLSYLYPNGNGPDYELVKKIEKLVFISNNYPIDNIAGLDDIQKYFYEEIIQPLINQENPNKKQLMIYFYTEGQEQEKHY